MYFITRGTLTHPEEAAPHRPEESRAVAALKERGIVKEVYRPVGETGVIGVMEADSLEDVRGFLGQLPFVELGFMTFDVTAVEKL